MDFWPWVWGLHGCRNAQQLSPDVAVALSPMLREAKIEIEYHWRFETWHLLILGFSALGNAAAEVLPGHQGHTPDPN